MARFILLLVGLFAANSLYAASYRIQAHQLRKTIEKAKAGDTLLVDGGRYAGDRLVIDKPLVLIGKNKPQLDGQKKVEILAISATDVFVSGFHFIRSGRSNIDDYAGIKANGAHRLQIVNNTFSETFFGIHISKSDQVIIRNNQLKATAALEHELGNGIHLWKCDQAIITNNTIEGHRDGIYFEFVTNTSINHNLSRYNKRYGLHFMFSNDNSYHKNVFRNNGAGVAVMYTARVSMTDNDFDENWGASAYGLLLKDIRDSRVEGNRFTGNTSAIYMEGTSRTHFERNLFKNNGWAVQLQASCDGNRFVRNNFIGNTFDIATNGSLVLNQTDQNYWDKYQGYDLNRDGRGDIPYYPVSLFSMVVERMPPAMLLWRSFLVLLLDRAERVLPAITPEDLKDHSPSMQPYDLYTTFK